MDSKEWVAIFDWAITFLGLTNYPQDYFGGFHPSRFYSFIAGKRKVAALNKVLRTKLTGVEI